MSKCNHCIYVQLTHPPACTKKMMNTTAPFILTPKHHDCPLVVECSKTIIPPSCLACQYPSPKPKYNNRIKDHDCSLIIFEIGVLLQLHLLITNVAATITRLMSVSRGEVVSVFIFMPLCMQTHE